MPTVARLFESKKNKADEFYTLYSDIEEELKNYIEYNGVYPVKYTRAI